MLREGVLETFVTLKTPRWAVVRPIGRESPQLPDGPHRC